MTCVVVVLREGCGEPRWTWDSSSEATAMAEARGGGGLVWLSGYADGEKRLNRGEI